MNKLRVGILLILISQWTFGQGDKSILDDNAFIAIEIGKTTFEQADKILKSKSFKEPSPNFKSVKWRSGNSSTLRTPHYYIEINHTKVEVVLRGWNSTVDFLEIRHVNGDGLTLKGITLGLTKVSDLKEINNNNWDYLIDIVERDTTYTNFYRELRIGIDHHSGADLLNKKIERFILQKKK